MAENELPSEGEIVVFLNNWMKNTVYPELMRNIFRIVLDGTQVIPEGETPIPIELLQASQHAIYLPPSVISLGNFIVDVYQTTGVVGGAVAAGINASIIRRRVSPFGLNSTEVILLLSNSLEPIQVSYRVWRVVGLSVEERRELI